VKYKMDAKIYNLHGWIEETDPSTLHDKFLLALVDSGFRVLNEVQHHFSPYGYTALFLLGESHLAIHTFPEHCKSYVELSSCVKKQYENFKTWCEPLFIQE